MLKIILVCTFFVLFINIFYAQDIQPAEHKRVKKGQLSYDYTFYTMRDGFNIPSMRVPEKDIISVKTPAAAFLIKAQNLLEAAKGDYQLQKEIKQLEEISYCINQVKALDWYWEHKTLKIEHDFYLDYEKKRYDREVVAVKKEFDKRQVLEKKRLDSLTQLFAMENYKADSIEQARKRYLESRKDSITKAQQFIGYHFVNAKSIDLRAAPQPNAPLIVSVRACSYVKKLYPPADNGYVFIEVSDYKGYVLNTSLVDNLNKIAVVGADVKFAKENHFVSIYVPAGSTYDPLRQEGTVPVAIHPEEYKNNPNALNELVAKLNKDNINIKEPKIQVDKITNNTAEPKIVAVKTISVPIANSDADIKVTVDLDKNSKNKKQPLIVLSENDKIQSKNKNNKEGSGKRKQCTIILSDGSQCPNVTTSNACKCYLHDN
jgi:hypothetical protein